jgi:hypothetical protein
MSLDKINESFVVMEKNHIWISVPQKEVGCLSYMAIGHSRFAPDEVIWPILYEYKLGILLLGVDGPSLLTSEQANRIVQSMNDRKIPAIVTAGFVWVSPVDAHKLCHLGGFSYESNAFLLRTEPVEENFECPYLPELSGWNKDRIKERYALLFSKMLSTNDIYIHDDFTESMIVTKNRDILRAMADEVRRLGN